ncbi:DUF421 domain-containing protein [Haloplasma contractile]|uniref:Transmembrane protein YrbG n=1 Tax=Haloplasma contractile SSD-17B TaxID=1033810 RepID=F7PX13_9MOLU|nr:DUF421 domain-containing protein [Haloplasma contractile]ERJ12748.1 transmembrane protein YrbG [Haloplasma contractile SSD-17B]
MQDIMTILLRVLTFYVIIFAVFKFMGKRELGELSIIDLIVFILIAEIAAISIEEIEEPMINMVAAISLLVIMQKVLAYISLKNSKVRQTIEGASTILIANGEVNYEEMSKERYTFNDLIAQLRTKDIRSISEVDFAILEGSGDLTVFKKGEDTISPLPVIVSGQIIRENLQYSHTTEDKLKNLLNEKGYNDLNNILYANFENDDLYIIDYSIKQ